jgi:ATP-dependent Clp protease ATP-binding subunit ClpA
MTDSLAGLFDGGDVLERVGVDLTAQARRSDLEPVRCRDAEVARVIDIVLRQSKNNPAEQGIVVRGPDVARVVALAVGKGIEWTG